MASTRAGDRLQGSQACPPWVSAFQPQALERGNVCGLSVPSLRYFAMTPQKTSSHSVCGRPRLGVFCLMAPCLGVPVVSLTSCRMAIAHCDRIGESVSLPSCRFEFDHKLHRQKGWGAVQVNPMADLSPPLRLGWCSRPVWIFP